MAQELGIRVIIHGEQRVRRKSDDLKKGADIVIKEITVDPFDQGSLVAVSLARGVKDRSVSDEPGRVFFAFNAGRK